MGIFYDLCMAIDIYNSSKKVKKKGLKNYIERKREEVSLKRLINRIAIESLTLDNTLIIEFMNIYESSKDTISIKGLTSGINNDTSILWLKYSNKNSALSIVSHNNEREADILSVRFEDLTPGTYPITFNLHTKFYYNGIDKKRVTIMRYANEVIRTFIKDYCIQRMNS